MTETAALAPLVTVAVGAAFIGDTGRVSFPLTATVEGHTADHYFEAQASHHGHTFDLMAGIPGLPPSILAHVCTVAGVEHAKVAVGAFYRAPAGTSAVAAAIAVSGLPHQIDWTGTV